MGCSASRGVNPIDAALIQALIEAKQKRGRHSLSFNELLLKFPKMAEGFKQCRKYFELLDLNGDRLIDMREFTSQAHKLGLDMDMEDLRNVFDAADIDHSTKIDVFEFVLVFVVVHLLSPERAASLPPEITTTLEIVEDAFCCFDASADGYLEREEVEAALCSANTPGRTTRALSERLFAQLDYDGSGAISFKEFLVGLEKMVLEEYEGEEDEAEAAARRDEEAALMQAAARRRVAAQAHNHHGGGSTGSRGAAGASSNSGSSKQQQHSRRQAGSPAQVAPSGGRAASLEGKPRRAGAGERQ